MLALDRVGYGASSHPNGDTLNYTTSAGYVHEVIQQVRGGALGDVPSAIILLGPSAGGDIALVEAGTYHDVDGLIVCSNTSQLQPAIFQVDFNAWFAQGDYFDFGVDFRTQFFYAAPFALPVPDRSRQRHASAGAARRDPERALQLRGAVPRRR